MGRTAQKKLTLTLIR